MYGSQPVHYCSLQVTVRPIIDIPTEGVPSVELEPCSVGHGT